MIHKQIPTKGIDIKNEERLRLCVNLVQAAPILV